MQASQIHLFFAQLAAVIQAERRRAVEHQSLPNKSSSQEVEGGEEEVQVAQCLAQTILKSPERQYQPVKKVLF